MKKLIPLFMMPSLCFGNIMSEREALSKYDPNNSEHVCLIKNIYFESRGEPIQGQLAVAQTTMRRKVINFRNENTICGVVYDNWQFEWTRKPGIHKRHINTRNKHWRKAIQVAYTVLHNDIPDYSMGATHFYNPYKVSPNWDWSKMEVKGDIGLHRFAVETKYSNVTMASTKIKPILKPVIKYVEPVVQEPVVHEYAHTDYEIVIYEGLNNEKTYVKIVNGVFDVELTQNDYTKYKHISF